jgi:nitrogen-specific signal transduction histidine kinase
VSVSVPIDAIPQALLVVDDTRVVACNEALAELVRRSVDAVVGLDLAELFAPDDCREVSALLDATGSSAAPWTPVAGRAGDGAPWIGAVRSGGPVEGGWLLLVSPASPPIGISGEASDAVEYARLSPWEELGLDRVISHDVRGGLRGVTSFLTLLERAAGEHLDGQAREFFDTANAAALRTDVMAERLVHLLRLTLRPVGLAPVALGDLVNDAIAASADTYAGSALSSEVGALPTVWGQPALLVELLAELVTNARKFGATGLVLRGDEVTGGWVSLAVADDGPGVEPELAEDAFNLFRLLQPKGRFPGVGMGLPIVRVIARIHGGRCWIEPHDPPGTTVRVRLLLAE